MTTTNSNKTNGDIRRESGRQHFTQVLNLLLKDVSHPEMTALADWALNEVGCLHTSQISHLRNAVMRMLGVKSIDALGAIITAGYWWKQSKLESGDRATFKNLGTAQTTAKIEEILERFEPVLHPETQQPLDSGDLMMVYLGRLQIELPGVPADQMADWQKASEKIGPWMEEMLEERGLRLRDAIAQIKQAWKGPDQVRDHFCFAVTGMGEFKPDALAEAWPHIAEVVSVLCDETVTPEDLLAMVTA